MSFGAGSECDLTDRTEFNRISESHEALAETYTFLTAGGRYAGRSEDAHQLGVLVVGGILELERSVGRMMSW